MILAACLVLIILLPAPAVQADVFPGSDAIPSAPANQAAYEDWLMNTGRPVSSRIHGYQANYEAFRDYRLLIYGTPSQVPGNRYDDNTMQYAKLGFSYDELEVTNSLFPDDSPGGVTRSSPWQWNELDMGQAARISWSRLDASQKAIIKTSVLTYRNNSYGGMTFNDLKMTENKSVVLAPPSWNLGFALYTTHYLPGSINDLRYATFNGSGAGSVNLACEIQVRTAPAADGKYVIGSSAEAVDIAYDVCGWVTAFQGLACESDIENCGAGNEQGWVAGTGAGPWVSPLVLRVSRDDLAGTPEQSFNLQGIAWVVSRNGDIQLCQIEKTVTVWAEKIKPPFSADASICGSIRYFSGQTNSLRQTMPLNPHRFLALERMKIALDFTQEPGNIEVIFSNKTIRIDGKAGQTHYEASLIIPDLRSTLAWDGRRLSPPMVMLINAVNADRSENTGIMINDIDVTGDIYDIAYAQAGS